eukprot:5838011-Alexandrium_andersonii.AAC.1
MTRCNALNQPLRGSNGKFGPSLVEQYCPGLLAGLMRRVEEHRAEQAAAGPPTPRPLVELLAEHEDKKDGKL